MPHLLYVHIDGRGVLEVFPVSPPGSFDVSSMYSSLQAIFHTGSCISHHFSFSWGLDPWI